MYQTSDIRKGLKVEIDGKPWTVVEFQFVKPGKGCAFTRTKLKNLLAGNVIERTFKSGEKLPEADVSDATMQYLYNDGEAFHFMDTDTYEQVAIPADVIKAESKWLVEEMKVEVLFYKGNPVNIDLPNFVELQIEYCEPGAKGNTAQGATKPATLTTGAEVNVPLFVEQGTWLKIDTRTGQYVERVRK
jgi:elongation factor P